MNSTLNDIRTRVRLLPSATPTHWMSTKKVSPLGALVVIRLSRTKPPASRTIICEGAKQKEGIRPFSSIIPRCATVSRASSGAWTRVTLNPTTLRPTHRNCDFNKAFWIPYS